MHDWVAIVRRRIADVGGPADSVLVDELAAHLEQEFEDARAEGLDDEAALRRAVALLDGSEPIARAVRAARPPRAQRLQAWARTEPDYGKGGTMTRVGLVRDARHALRLLVRAPLVSAIAILTFAVGIGVNAAVFSVLNAVLLRPLPYPDADRITLVWLDNQRQGIREDITSYPNYRDWRDRNTTYAQLAAYDDVAFTLTGVEEPERIIGATVTANFFEVMGVAPQLGRLFTAAHETPGQDDVVVISDGLWQRRFGGAASVLGQKIVLNGRPHEVIGVMPPALAWPIDAELWKPLAPGDDAREARGSFWLPVIGRLKPGVAVEQAQAEMSGISAQIAEEYEFMRGFGANVVPLHRQLVGDVEQGLLLLAAAVGFVLLIACANLANLLFSRTSARRKELAIRSALGAARTVLVRQIVTEALVLGLIGSVCGVLLAYWSLGFFTALAEGSIPRGETIAVDLPVILFCLALAVLAAVLSAAIPAWHASRAAAADHLREGGRQHGGTSSHRTRSALVGLEMAAAFVLLTGAGLFIQTLWHMQRTDRGFATDGIAMVRISPPAATYARAADVRALYARLLAQVRAMPGVTAAATGTAVLQPLLTNSTVFRVEGQPLPPPEERVEYPFEIVSPGYFETLDVPIVRGRSFTEADHADAPRVVIVNETLARTVWPDQDPIGRRLSFAGDAPWMTVVGVIRDMHRAAVTRAIRPEVYLSAVQTPPRTQWMLVKTAGDPNALIGALRRELRAIDPQLPLFDATTLADTMSRSLWQPRFQATLLAAFAAIAVLLAAIGIYGVTAHTVTQRTQEVGIRMALGAARGDVLRLVLTEHLRPALVGIAAGIAGALALARYLRTLLFGVEATDPLTFAAMAAGLLAVAAVACWLPAVRATRVDPLVAVRAE